MSKFILNKKKPLFGNKRSYSMNTCKRKFFFNLHNHRFWLVNKKKFIKLRVSTREIRTINKLGIEKFLFKFKNIR